MADGAFAFELASPEALVYEADVDMVVVPGSEGDFGVLVEHAPFISGVRPGVVEVYRGERVVDRLFVADGFAEVTGSRCTVLAREATPVERIERAAAEARLAAAEADLRDADSDPERAQAEREVAIASAMLAAIAG